MKEIHESIEVDLQAIVDKAYAEGAYSIRLNYTNPVPPPALSETDDLRSVVDHRLWI